MSVNDQIAARVAATQGKQKQAGHPNKHQTTMHPVSRKRGKARKGA